MNSTIHYAAQQFTAMWLEQHKGVQVMTPSEIVTTYRKLYDGLVKATNAKEDVIYNPGSAGPVTPAVLQD